MSELARIDGAERLRRRRAQRLQLPCVLDVGFWLVFAVALFAGRALRGCVPLARVLRVVFSRANSRPRASASATAEARPSWRLARPRRARRYRAIALCRAESVNVIYRGSHLSGHLVSKRSVSRVERLSS